MEPDEALESAFPILDRLVQAGWATSWTYRGERLLIEWNPCHEEIGGEQTFLRFVESLVQLCPETPLSELDQAMLVILEQIHFDEVEGGAG